MSNDKIKEILRNGNPEDRKKLRDAAFKRAVEKNKEALKRLAKH
jgi:hypothetical protein